MGSISLENVSKSFGAVTVIQGVDIEMADGEFVVMVGPSGCGKSTLLRMIAGLEAISGGTMKIDGKQVNNLPPKDRNIAMVFQNYALYPHLSVADNMGFSLKLRGTQKADIDERVAFAAKILDLEAYLDRKPRQLSGGQRQRVAMGRAIVRNPSVFLFDEPLSNLDAKLRVAMRTEIKELHQRLGITTVYVTHDQTEAMTMADRIIVLRDGRVEQIGAPLEIYDCPTTSFVATFIGTPSMNLFEGIVDESGSSLRIEDGLELQLPVKLEPGRRATYGVRPCDLKITKDGAIVANIAVIEPTGAETLLVARTPAGREIGVVVRERFTLKSGQTIRLSTALAAVHLFDTETGLRLGH